MRVFGVPIQFAIVVVVSAALTIFFGAWAVDARVEARAQSVSVSTSQFSFAFVDSDDGSASDPQSPESQEWWEKSFLFACPFH